MSKWVKRVLAVALVCVLVGGAGPISGIVVHAAGDDIQVLAAGGEFTLALENNGTVWAWGENRYGQLGDTTTTNRYTPIQVQGLGDAISIAAGYHHSIALKRNGMVWGWGQNAYGQLGDNTTTNRYVPVQVQILSEVISIAAGEYHTLALKSDGTVWAWGQNSAGQLGDNTITNRYVPTQVQNLTSVVSVSAGSNFSLALKSDGTVWAWGQNTYGQLGNTANSPTPIQVRNLSDIIAVSAGQYHSLALKNDGSVWAWGYNNYGQLGDDSIINRDVPTQVQNLSGVTAVAAGFSSSLVLKNDNTVWAWGYNEHGQIGDNTEINRYSPVPTQNMNDVIAIAAYGQSIALKNDGTVWAWGWNGLGKLGDGTTTYRLYPVQVKGQNGEGSLNLGEYGNNFIRQKVQLSTGFIEPQPNSYYIDYSYSDDLFANISTMYNHRLAKASLTLAIAAYGASWNDFGPLKAENVVNMLENSENDPGWPGMGFNDVWAFGYDREPAYEYSEENALLKIGDDPDTIAAVFAHKTLPSGKEMIVAAVRGGEYKGEWGGNFNIGSGEIHRGFEIAKSTVRKWLNQYVEQYIPNSTNAQFWVTGYSRGSAVANLLAAELDNDSKSGTLAMGSKTLITNRDNIYGYCFAVPNNSRKSIAPADKDLYCNIYNICNPADFVPKMAPYAWGYFKYGNTLWLPAKGDPNNDYDFEVIENRMIDEFAKISNLDGADAFTRESYLINKFREKKIENLLAIYPYPVIINAPGNRTQAQYLDQEVFPYLSNSIFKDQDYYVANLQDAFINLMLKFGRDDKWGLDDFNGLKSKIVGIVYNNLNAVISLFENGMNVAQGHFPEIYLAWMRSLPNNYFGTGQPENEVKANYRVAKMNCPVDVRVYNKHGTLVASIISESVWALESSEVTATIDRDGQKLFCLPIKADYDIRIAATGNGNMTYSVSEFTRDVGASTRIVNYYEIPITSSSNFKAQVPTKTTETQLVEYSLYSVNGSNETKINPSEDLKGETAQHAQYTVEVVSDEEQGLVAGGGVYEKGSYAQVQAESKEGYAFDGWYINNNCVSIDSIYRFCVKQNIMLIAKFRMKTADTCILIYDANGGTGAPSGGTYMVGERVAISEIKPKRDGYTFLGWALTRDAINVFTTPGRFIRFEEEDNGEVTFYAVWANPAPVVTSKYNANGGTGASPDVQHPIYESFRIGGAKDPVRAGYRLLGWATQASATTPDWDVGEWIQYTGLEVVNGIGKTIIWYAVWEKMTTYTLTLNANGGSVSPTSHTGTEGQTYTLPTPTRNGYTFTSWTLSGGGSISGNVYTFGTSNGTVVAQWTANTTNYIVMVNSGTGGGSYAANASVNITASTAPSGKVFDKWTSSDGVTFANANASTTSFTMPAKNVAVTATYKDAPSTVKKIFSTRYDATFLNWILFFLCFGWIWMWF